MHLSSLAPGNRTPYGDDMLIGDPKTGKLIPSVEYYKLYPRMGKRTSHSLAANHTAFAPSGPQPTSLYNGMSDAKIMWRIVMGGDFSALAEANRRGIFISENTARKMRSKLTASTKQGTPSPAWMVSAVNNAKIEAQSSVAQRADNRQKTNTIRKTILLRKKIPNYRPTQTRHIIEKNKMVDDVIARAGGDMDAVLGFAQQYDRVNPMVTRVAQPTALLNNELDPNRREKSGGYPPTLNNELDPNRREKSGGYPPTINNALDPNRREKSGGYPPTINNALDPGQGVTTSSFVVPGTGSGGGMMTPYNDFSDFDKSANSVQEAIADPTNWPLIIGGGVGAIALLIILTKKKAK